MRTYMKQKEATATRAIPIATAYTPNNSTGRVPYKLSYGSKGETLSSPNSAGQTLRPPK